MVKITNKGILTKVLQDTSPAELQVITLETYTPFKKKFLEDNKEIKIGAGTLPEYV